MNFDFSARLLRSEQPPGLDRQSMEAERWLNLRNYLHFCSILKKMCQIKMFVSSKSRLRTHSDLAKDVHVQCFFFSGLLSLYYFLFGTFFELVNKMKTSFENKPPLKSGQKILRLCLFPAARLPLLFNVVSGYIHLVFHSR